MNCSVDERAILLGNYIAENNATVRTAANQFSVSKSTVHKDVTYRLSRINPQLYERVKLVLDTNKAERHLRGGHATRKRSYEHKIKTAQAISLSRKIYIKMRRACKPSSVVNDHLSIPAVAERA